tara:strand:- start:586 stop:1056 length:471 start_codon:yes stop_codon:yes gene_type:complete
MGSYFYTPKKSLAEKLLTNKNDKNHFFMRGDILLIQTDNLFELLDGHHISDVAIVCKKMVFVNGNFENLDEFIDRHEKIWIRRIIKPAQYNLFSVCKSVQEFLIAEQINICERSAISASMVLMEMELIDELLISPHLYESYALKHHDKSVLLSLRK